MVVFNGLASRWRAAKAAICPGGGGSNPKSATRSDIHGSPVAVSATSPAELTTTIAPTVTPDSSTTEAVPTPPLSTPARAPMPAPAQPTATSTPAFAAAAYPNSAVGRFAHPPTGRSKITAAGTIGTVPPFICTPRPCSSSQRITPSAAASPNALPPVRTTASTWRMLLDGSSSSVSRLPGAPPRTSTAPTVPGGATTTVVPQAHPRPGDGCSGEEKSATVASGSHRWWWPTRTPPTSVIDPVIEAAYPSIPIPGTPATQSATDRRRGGWPSGAPPAVDPVRPG